ncbi:MAG: hypothetical protein C0518_12535 [Opitutus sp.]|nr:hypothetical protein [Opitutus sp.]
MKRDGASLLCSWDRNNFLKFAARAPMTSQRRSVALFDYAMHTRMLSFLSDVERALAADDPAPDDGSWETSRTVNYHLGLARLTLNVRSAAGVAPRGTVLLQGYQLADGTPCLKAALNWHGTESTNTRAIYSKPDINWTSEARKVAAEWMAGPPSDLLATADEPRALAVAS